MATGKDFIDYILDQLSPVDGITCQKMMGEYILYMHGRIAAYVCDDRLLIKPVAAARRLLPEAPMEAPYLGAKELVLVEETDDRELLVRLFAEIYPELPQPKKKLVKASELC